MSATLTPTKESFQNYAQIRAKHAFNVAQKWKEEWEKEKKNNPDAKFNYDVASKKLPYMIIENGLLGAMAFALEKKGECTEAGKLYDILSATLEHLKDTKIGAASTSISSVEEWIEELAKGEADQFRRAVTESMEYLSYLRRFAKKDEKKEE